MSNDPVTLTLPFLTWQGAYVLLTALGIFIATGLMWLMLNGAERARPATLESWAKAGAWVLAPVWLWLLGATLWGLWQVFNDAPSPLASGSLGLGALIAAFLGAPFVIYGTWLKHKTNRLEQEGHMTDRINKAVEQLGADKIIERDGKKESVPNIEVRMGAILSLERIAQDSTIHDKGRDHVRVMEILCAYIRENSNARKPVDFPLAEWKPLKDAASEEERAEHEELRTARFHAEGGPLALQWAQSLPKPRVDVQLALTVIGRRSAEQLLVEAAWPDAPSRATVWPFAPDFKHLPDDHGDLPLGTAALETFNAGLIAWREKLRAYRGYQLDFRGANLQCADMAATQPDRSNAVFSGALFTAARMEGANFIGARITGCDLDRAGMLGTLLWEAQIDGASLVNIKMEGAQLDGASIVGADLESARLEGADLSRSHIEATNGSRAMMEGANLERACMVIASLHDSRLDGARLARATMDGAELSWARVEGAYFTGAQMRGVDLYGARPEGASFVRARLDEALLWAAKMDGRTFLRDAVLRWACMKGVDYSKVSLSQAQIDSCFGDSSVILPSAISRPNHWPNWELPDFSDSEFETEWRKWQDNPEGYTPPPKPE